MTDSGSTQGNTQDVPVNEAKPSRSVVAYVYEHRLAFITLIIFLINLVLVSPSLMPGFLEVNPDDEAKYVESGWRLLKGDIRDLSWGPLVSMVYAPIHLIVGHSPDWFLLETWAGRFLLFTFLWWATFYLACQFKERGTQFIALGVLFVATPFFLVIKNQSDALFVGFSALALAHVIIFHQHGKLKDIGIASLLVGLGVLARLETILLLITLIIFAIVLGRSKHQVLKILSYSIVPAMGVLAIFFIASLLLIGNLNLGFSYKSYDSFEWNQSILTGGDIDLAREETRRLFGTQEENHGSVLRAILRNPAAFSQRLLANAKTIPVNYFDFFGKKLGALLLFFAAWGAYFQRRKKEIATLLILVIWPLHALVALGFLALHIIPQVVYLPLLLASVGIAGIFGLDFHSREKWSLLISSFLIMLVSWMTGKPAFGFGFLMLVVVLLLSWLVQFSWKENQHPRLLALFLLFAVGLILRDPYPFPEYPELGKTADEQAVHFLEQAFPDQTSIIVPSPLPAIAARMSYRMMEDIPENISSVQDLSSWLKLESVEVVQIDSNRRVRNDIYDLFEGGHEVYFQPEFTSEDGRIRVFRVK